MLTSIEPEFYTNRAPAAVAFYEAAFGAAVVHQVGDGDDIVARLSVGDARFWVTAADPRGGRLDPLTVTGATARVLLVCEDPEALHDRAVAAGATTLAPVAREHGWLVGRILDPFGHEWELGRLLGDEPPA